MAKIYRKHQGVLKTKVNLLMEVFEVNDLPLWMATVLCGLWLSFLGVEFVLSVVISPWAIGILPAL